MKIQQCPNGHYYDSDRYASGCPYCKTQTPLSTMHVFSDDRSELGHIASDMDSEKTMPLTDNIVSGNSEKPVSPLEQVLAVKEDTGVTMPLYEGIQNGPVADAEVTMPIAKAEGVTGALPAEDNNPSEPIDFTVSPAPAEQIPDAAEDTGVTMPLYEGIQNGPVTDAEVTMPIAKAEGVTGAQPAEDNNQSEPIDFTVSPAPAEQIPDAAEDTGVTMPLYEGIQNNPVADAEVTMPIAKAEGVTGAQPAEDNNQSEPIDFTVSPAEQIPDAAEDTGVTMPVYTGTQAEPKTGKGTTEHLNQSSGVIETAEETIQQSNDNSSDTVNVSERTRMNIKKCKNNHLFDGSRFSECPYCKNNIVIVETGSSDESGIKDFSYTKEQNDEVDITSQSEDAGVTMPLGTPATVAQQEVEIKSGFEANKPNNSSQYSQSGIPAEQETMPFQSQFGGGFSAAADEGVTMPVFVVSQPAPENPPVQNNDYNVPGSPVIKGHYTTSVSNQQNSYPVSPENQPKISYNRFLKNYVPKKVKIHFIFAGIASLIYAVLMFAMIPDSYNPLGPIIIGGVYAAIGVLTLVRRKFIYPAILLAYEIILIIIGVASGQGLNIGLMDWIVLATSIDAICFGIVASNMFKEYKRSGSYSNDNNQK